jgi:hypothetical protein
MTQVGGENAWTSIEELFERTDCSGCILTAVNSYHVSGFHPEPQG